MKYIWIFFTKKNKIAFSYLLKFAIFNNLLLPQNMNFSEFLFEKRNSLINNYDTKTRI